MSLQPLSPLRYKRLFQYITRIPNLVAYYPMFEQEGTICKNYAPKTKGTNNGTSANMTLGVNGKTGKAYKFNGTTSKVTIPNTISVKNQSLISVGAIVKVTDNAATKHILFESRSADNFTRFSFELTATEVIQFSARVADSAAAQITTGDHVISSGYHFISMSLDVANKAILFYIDGANETFTGSLSGFSASAFDNSNPISGPQVGGTNTAGTFNDELQHIVIIHGRLVSASEWLKIAKVAGLA